jgi:glycosyltransferase involved in cell wall biosynthesis
LHPFFTIGVPTYNRHGLLRETLDSILTQNFTDFEVLVGNDFTEEILTGETLGIADPRLHFINHPVNLREVGNMNVLLAAARGRYFTWLFDDDLLEPGFFSTAHATLSETGYPHALYTSYRVINDEGITLDPAAATDRITLFNGAGFLSAYFSGTIKLNSTCGMFDTEALTKTVGGVEELCDSAIGLYCEYLFLVRCGLFERIAYLDSPLVVFRAHADSWGEKNTEIHKYREAGRNLLRRCGSVLYAIDQNSLSSHLIDLSKIHLITFATKSVAYEINGGNAGISAMYRALQRFFDEAAAIRKVCITLTGSWTFHVTLTFLKIQIHCFQFILGKFRVYNKR